MTVWYVHRNKDGVIDAACQPLPDGTSPLPDSFKEALDTERDADLQAYMAKLAPTYADKRRAEYPSVGDQLDALWKGNAAAEAMKAEVEAVKARHPKPTGGGM